VLKLQQALKPFSCVKLSYITKPPETNGIPCSKALHYGKKKNLLTDFINGETAKSFLWTSVFKFTVLF